MSTPLLRRSLALSAAVLLALTGGLLAAGPASAAPGTLTVDPVSPTSRSVVLTGGGTDGGTIVAATDGTGLAGSTTVASGRWSITFEFTELDSATQTVTVTQTVEEFADDPDEVTVTFVLPPSSTSGVLTVDDPAPGGVLASPIVTFTGTAPAGSRITLDRDPGARGVILADEQGSFSYPTVLRDGPGATVTLTFRGVDANGIDVAPATVTVTLPPAIAAPVILSPGDGATLAGPSVMFSGTGVPGEIVQLLIQGLDAETIEANGGGGDAGPLSRTIAVPGAGGTWSVTLSGDDIAEGNYSVRAFHRTEEVNGQFDSAVLSGDSNTVRFSVRYQEDRLAATG